MEKSNKTYRIPLRETIHAPLESQKDKRRERGKRHI